MMSLRFFHETNRGQTGERENITEQKTKTKKQKQRQKLIRNTAHEYGAAK